jgi:hypothetical protein
VYEIARPLSNKRYRTRRAKSVVQDIMYDTIHTLMP